MRKIVCFPFVLVGVLMVCVGCSHEYDTKRDYRIDYYMDTIEGHVIISAVCSENDGNGISISSINVGLSAGSK